MLLKGLNKPYEEIWDPLYEIARKKRYEDGELADIKITIKQLGERLKVNTNYFLKVTIHFPVLPRVSKP